MKLADLLTDTAAIGRMTEQEFDAYWAALGTVVRLICRAAPPEPAKPQPERKGELSCTNAGTERAAAWDHDKRRPIVANKIGFALQPAAPASTGDQDRQGSHGH